MPRYTAPTKDLQFIMHDVLKATETGIPGYDELEADFTSAVLEEAGKIASEVLQPLNLSGDQEGCALENGVVRTSTYPASGFFLVPVVVLVALAASLAPALKKSSPNGLNEEPEAFGPFNPKAELTNGRASMVGLVSLWAAEHFTNGAALFGF